MTDLERARLKYLADDLPAGPWVHRRADDGALLLEAAADGEPLALIYAGLPFARWLEATSPAALLSDDDDDDEATS